MATQRKRITTVAELIAVQLGVEFVNFREGEINDVDIADKVVVQNHPGRAALLFVNLGTDFAVFRPLAAATTTRGIRLTASGGSVSMNYIDDLIMPTLEWHGVGNIDNTAIFVVEVLIEP